MNAGLNSLDGLQDLGVGFIFCQNYMTGNAVSGNGFPVVSLEFIVVATETAAGHALVSEVIRIRTPSDVHVGKHVRHVQILQSRDRLLDGVGDRLGDGAPTLREAVREAAREVERALITEALRTEKGNKSAAARRLGVSRPTLDAKMEALKIPRFPA